MTTKADVQAAERLLKAAVKRARDSFTYWAADEATMPPYEREDVEAMLRAAGESAELLLGADR